MADESSDQKWIKRSLLAAAILAAAIVPFCVIESAVAARVVAIGGLCLLLWLLELVPPFVPTLLLWILIPLVLAPLDPRYSFANTLRWAADPVLALFFGGFALGVATERHGLDKKLAALAVRWSRASYPLLLLVTIGLTAFMSMWISNIAAAALMFAGIRPLLAGWDTDHIARRTLLVGVAVGANFGGMATPVGTGPNAIAIASLSGYHQVSFIEWMVFAFPLTAGLLILGFAFLWWRARDEKVIRWQPTPSDNVDDRMGRNGLVAIFLIAVLLWLSEPLHGVSAPVVAMVAAVSLFLFRVLSKSDLARIDWSTLLLIAGGITLGRLLEASELVHSAATGVASREIGPILTLFIFCFASATLSALMSNTATAVLLIPLASAVMPQPSTAILIAISASFGMPFVISTPPNAMAHGEGGVRASDLFYVGIAAMIVGCAIVSVTGRAALNLVGIP